MPTIMPQTQIEIPNRVIRERAELLRTPIEFRHNVAREYSDGWLDAVWTFQGPVVWHNTVRRADNLAKTHNNFNHYAAPTSPAGKVG